MSTELKLKYCMAIIAFIIIVIVLYLNYLAKVNRIKKGKKKKNKDIVIIEVQYLFVKYHILKERLYNPKFALLFAIVNGLIICGTFIIVDLVPWGFFFQMLVGFVLLLGLIYSLYGIIGNILVKRGYQHELQ